MDICTQTSLKTLNTFGIDVDAHYFSSILSLSDVREVVEINRLKGRRLWVLGGGSNVLFVNNPDRWILKNNIKGLHRVTEDEDFVYVDAAGGENWHDFVMSTLDQGWYGLENLALIPGSVGASPIQNIGAYGREVKDFIERVDAIDLDSGAVVSFDSKACDFGYRNSRFKKNSQDHLFIYNVRFKLLRNPKPQVEYRALKEELERLDIKKPTPLQIAQCVMTVRQSKLPDPEKIGNSGSFFKNPVISKTHFKKLKSGFPQMPGYPEGDHQFKVAAGWLIEKAGWKGFRHEDAGVHEKQALVLVNYGKASGKDILKLSESIIQDVKNKFGITLAREVNIIE